MSESTGISWTDSTINVWHGCAKVDELCRNCYAEVSTPVRVKRAAGLEVWGLNAARSETKAWLSDLRKWGRAVVRTANGGPWRVFGQSLSDTFEDRRDLDPLRARFFAALTEWHSRSLIFQLLTKRPENVCRMVPPSWLDAWPAHVWIGTSVGDVKSKARIAELRKVPAAIRFLSIEPQIEDVGALDLTGISWVIVGGESGSKARPFDLAWARDIVRQCRAAGVAVFVKQMGTRPVAPELFTWRAGAPAKGHQDRPLHTSELVTPKGHVAAVVWYPVSPEPGDQYTWHTWDVNGVGGENAVDPTLEHAQHEVVAALRRQGVRKPATWHVASFLDSHGGDPSEWPLDLRVREFPTVPA